ncbi:MAG: hypothetical protein RR626_04975 [Anaerovoracaceae bacterium]
MIELRIQIEDIDYSKAADYVMPAISGKLTGKAAKAALAMLPQKAKDDLAVELLNRYKPEIKKAIEGKAAEKEITIKIVGIDIENMG